MLKQLMPALKMTIVITVLTGLIYPAAVTGVCQLAFKSKADGSLFAKNGRVEGSFLIGQNFSRPEYFHPRPSAAGPHGYDPTASGSSNLGPTNQRLYDRIRASAEQFRKENPKYVGSIPADALTVSGSGLDPDISPANAAAQTARVAEARGATVTQIQDLIASITEERGFGFLGEPRVNVVKLNMALDRQFPKH
ncbi:MAG TPA: potassium-transporting ATPase subunit KdpC [Bryobacteraceae bacterium]|nr:potassium-transporting ATPase subunit KdpC [Bryobacteraceae bacterium]